jgi:hypothetical protein
VSFFLDEHWRISCRIACGGSVPDTEFSIVMAVEDGQVCGSPGVSCEGRLGQRHLSARGPRYAENAMSRGVPLSCRAGLRSAFIGRAGHNTPLLVLV